MSAIEGFLYRQVVNTYHSSTSGRTLILGKDTHDVYTLIQAVCVVIATSNRVLATPFTSGVARTWVMPGPSSWSLPVRGKFFAFIFQLSGWALVAPSCFVLMYARIYIVFALHAPNHMHALTATCMHCRML